MIGSAVQERSGPAAGAAGRIPLLFLVSIQFVAFWPVWEWWMFRMIRYADNRPALAAPLLGVVICAALVMTGKARRGEWAQEIPRATATAAILMAVFAALWWSVHPLFPAVVAVGCVSWSAASVLAPQARSGLAALMVLGLPVLPSLQTHLGYPMRLLTTVTASVWLRLMGVPVMRDGLGLRWHEQLVLVDEPCSGVRMLWSGLVLAMALAAVYGLSAARTCLLGVAALAALVIGNLFRSIGVFFLETGALSGSGFIHEGVGLVAFGGVAALLVYGARMVQKREDGVRRRMAFSGMGGLSVYLTMCLGAALTPFIPGAGERGEPASGVTPFPGWPARFEGAALRPIVMGRREKAFYEGFPGEVACFSDGRRQIIMRWAAGETDKFHLSSACLKGVGYTVEPKGDAVDSEGTRWGTLLAVRETETLSVRERIHDGAGGNWTSEASWRWSRLWRRTSPPWWGITVIEAAIAGDEQKLGFTTGILARPG